MDSKTGHYVNIAAHRANHFQHIHEGIRISVASGILLVGVVMCTQTPEYNKVKFSNFSVGVYMC